MYSQIPLIGTVDLGTQPLVVTTLLIAFIVLIELVVFLAALITLRMGEFQESHGRSLKLVGGMIMVALALVLAFDPDLMNDVGSTPLLFVVTIGLALLIMGVHQRAAGRAGK
jgi:phosphatidylglycerophosphate synthase